MARFYSTFIGAGDLCFDVGANVGERTAAFLDLQARVVAIEPQSGCLKQLHTRFAGEERVTIVGSAVGEQEGHLDLHVCEGASTISTMSTKWTTDGRFARDYQWTQTERVEVTTLTRLIERFGKPRFCKIDVEGFEPSVIRGLTTPVPLLCFEFTREFMDDAKACAAHLESLAPIWTNVSIGESMELLSRQWVAPETLYSLLDSLEDPLLWGDIYVRVGG